MLLVVFKDRTKRLYFSRKIRESNQKILNRFHFLKLLKLFHYGTFKFSGTVSLFLHNFSFWRPTTTLFHVFIPNCCWPDQEEKQEQSDQDQSGEEEEGTDTREVDGR